MKKNDFLEKYKATAFARVIIYLMAFAVFSVCLILLPELAREERVSNPNAGPAWPFLIAAWVYAIPIFLALYQTFKLTKYIDAGTAFSKLSVIAIRNIKKSAIVFALLIVLGAMFVIALTKGIDPGEDVTPIVTIGIIFTFASVAVATFTATLEKLLTEALKMKEENDLTV